jgi:polyphosphate kinase
VEDAVLARRMIDELDIFISDDRNAWLLQTDGSYRRADVERGLSAQQHLMNTADRAPIFGDTRRAS